MPRCASIGTIPELPINRVVGGDALAVLRTLPSESIDTRITSPPYWALRNYRTHHQIWDGNSTCKHRWKSQSECIKCRACCGELGLEPSIDRYVNHLADVFDQVRRVLVDGRVLGQSGRHLYPIEERWRLSDRRTVAVTNANATASTSVIDTRVSPPEM